MHVLQVVAVVAHVAHGEVHGWQILLASAKYPSSHVSHKALSLTLTVALAVSQCAGFTVSNSHVHVLLLRT